VVREPVRAFESFFDDEYDGVRRSLAVAFGDAARAEELAQDAFTRALASWRRVSRMERPAGWVYVVALRAGRRAGRGREAPDAARAGEPMGDPAEAVTSSLALRDAIARLPERQRVALVLRYLADLPLADVADAMGCAVGTVKSTLHAALARLGEQLRDEEEADAAR
jgi:RNA polymerase sigma-70 factor (ECF subfamily)